MRVVGKRKFQVVLIAVAIIVFGGLVGFGFLQYQKPKKPPAPPEKTEVTVTQVTPHNTPIPGNPRLENPTEDYKKEILQNQKKQKIQDVSITSNGFIPQTVTLKKGGIITWTNEDKTNHQVVGESNLWGSKIELKPGQKFSQQFDVPGEYLYSCSLQPELKAKILVQE